jgi:pimeloyl-ACP methyl ester carboxylesterase/DNA-binding winged helix-turn-helix (wHTH) protein
LRENLPFPAIGRRQGGPNLHYLFGDYALDTNRRELRQGADLVALEPQVFDLLVFLIQNRDRVVSKDDLIASIWGGRIVSESTLTSRINAVRKAVGDSGEHQNVVRTVPRKGVRFVGAVKEDAIAPAPGTASAAEAKPLRQEVHFCTAPDGVRIAYAETGQGPPLVRTGHWLTHLEYDWESPVWSPYLQTFAANHRLIRYDARGNGLSDWEIEDLSFEAFVRDLETVVEATGLESFDLLGMSQGAAVSVAYAVRYPKRIKHLVLYGGFTRGRRVRGNPQEVAQSDAVVTLMRQGWGQENPAFRQLFTSLFIPGGTAEQVQWFNDLQRLTASPENAVRLRNTVDTIDVTALLPQVRTPTLVLHIRDDAVQPFDEGRRLAAGIPGARFVALEGRNHCLLPGDPGWARFHDEVRAFLTS